MGGRGLHAVLLQGIGRLLVRRSPRPRGMALATVLLALAVMVVLSFTLATASYQAMNLADGDMRMERARYAAEAGANDAYAQLKADGTWSAGFTDKPLVNQTSSTYSVTVFNNSAGSSSLTASDETTVLPGNVYIISTGKYAGALRTACVMMQQPLNTASLFMYAIFADKSLSITAGAVTDGYDSRLGSYGTSNNSQATPVGTNGSATTSGGITVPGDVLVAGSLTTSGSLNIHGKIAANGTINLGASGTTVGDITSATGDINFKNTFSATGNVNAAGNVTFPNCPTINGDVTAGKAITFTNSAKVTGNASAVNSIALSWGCKVGQNAISPTVSLPGGSYSTFVTGSVNLTTPAYSAPSAVAAVTLPEVDCTYSTPNSNSSLQVTNKGWGSGTVVDGSNNLTIAKGETITLPPGNYYFNNISVTNGNLNTTSSGGVKIYTTGTIGLGSCGVVNNATKLPADLQIYSSNTTSSAFTLSGAADIYAAVYVPKGTANLTAGGSFYGSLVAGTLTSSGGSKFHYDVALQQIKASTGSSGGSLTVTSWERR